jgi:hypothetical protein
MPGEFICGDLTGPSSAETDFDPEDVLTVDMNRVLERLKSSSPFEGGGEEQDVIVSSGFDRLALGELSASGRRGNSPTGTTLNRSGTF